LAPLTNVTLTNIVFSTSDTTDLIATNNNGLGTNSIVTTAVTPIADLQTSKTGPPSMNAGSNIVYTITVTNLGPSVASNVVVKDYMPTNQVWVGASGGGVSNNGTITWPTIASLAAGSGTSFFLTNLAPLTNVTLTNIV